MTAQYVLVLYPYNQVILNQDWFKECILLDSEEQVNKYGFPTYLIPLEYFNSVKNEIFNEIFASHQR
jgi:hypothetical protein